MIRVYCLVKIFCFLTYFFVPFPALQDLDPCQLLLFVQSFGIPAHSMSKLLQCLDNAVNIDRARVEQSVVDKSYMAQLIEVQHKRGSEGGDQFYSMLTGGGTLEHVKGKLIYWLSIVLCCFVHYFCHVRAAACLFMCLLGARLGVWNVLPKDTVTKWKVGYACFHQKSSHWNSCYYSLRKKRTNIKVTYFKKWLSEGHSCITNTACLK